VFSPRAGTGEPDAMFKVLTDSGVPIPQVPKTVPIGVGGYSVALTPEEQAQYATLRGQYFQQLLQQIAATPGFSTSPLAAQKKILQAAFAQIDAGAKQQVIAQIPPSDLMQRVQENMAGKAPVPLAVPGPLVVPAPLRKP
jgi:hypothetical protein